MLNVTNAPIVSNQRFNTVFKGKAQYAASLNLNSDIDTVVLSSKQNSEPTKKTGIAALIIAGTALAFGIAKNKQKDIPNVIKGVTTAVKEVEHLVFQSPNLNLIKKKYNSKNLFDLGVKYATIANNTKHATGRALLKNEVPAVFKGLDENILLNELDKLPKTLETAVRKIYPEKSGTISIAGKVFKFERLGQGCSNQAYKLVDEKGNCICFKHAHTEPRLGMNNGIIDEVALLNEANKAGVVDVPKLYMANLFGVKSSKYEPIEGAWQLVEMVDSSKTFDINGLRLKKWLNNLGLVHGDLDANPNNVINDVVIDMGMIGPKKFKSCLDCDTSQSLMQYFNEGKTTEEALNSLENEINKKFT